MSGGNRRTSAATGALTEGGAIYGAIFRSFRTAVRHHLGRRICGCAGDVSC